MENFETMAGGPGAEAERTQFLKIAELSASAGHEDWKRDFKEKARAKGEAETRPKATKPEERERWGETVDIANLNYEQLPPSWQGENRASGEAAATLVLTAASEGKALDEGFIEEASAKIHDAWLVRNALYAPPEQKLPYEELSEDQKEKDRIFVRSAIKAYEENPLEVA